MSTPLILEVAVNGMTTPAINPAVPRTPDQIVTDSLACLEAGASIIHCHIDDAKLAVDDTVAVYGDIFSRVLKEFPQALIYPTWRAFDSAEERHAHLPPLAARGLTRLSYLDPGSTNVGTALDAHGQPAGSHVYINTYDGHLYCFGLKK